MSESKKGILAKLDEIDNRYSEIESQISKPEIAGDSIKLVALSKEQGKLKAIVSKYREYKKLSSQLTEAQQIQLMAIMKEMQAKTLAVLTKEQAAKLKTLKSAPETAQKKKPTKAKTEVVEDSDGTKTQSKK